MSLKNAQSDSFAGPESSNPEIVVQFSESLRQRAEELAAIEGVSLEDFILYAIAEKIARSKPLE